METRKVQLSGGTTYTISLPKHWAEGHGIEAGTVLNLYPKDEGRLEIELNDSPHREIRKAQLDAKGLETKRVKKLVNAMYAIGIEQVEINDRTGHSEDRRLGVSETVRTLSGFEVLESSDSSLSIRNLIDAENVSIRKTTLRLRLIMLAMVRDAVKALIEDDPELATQTINQDDEVNKLYMIVKRHFKRAVSDLSETEKLGLDREQLFELYQTAHHIELIADQAKNIAGYVLHQHEIQHETFGEQFEACAEDARSIVERASKVILEGTDIAEAFDAQNERDRLTDTLDQVSRDFYNVADASQYSLYRLLLDSLQQIADNGAAIADVAIEKHARVSEFQ